MTIVNVSATRLGSYWMVLLSVPCGGQSHFPSQSTHDWNFTKMTFRDLTRKGMIHKELNTTTSTQFESSSFSPPIMSVE